MKRLVLSNQVGRWCQLPYPGHPKGCPNFGKLSTCPPQAGSIEERFNLSKPLFLVHSEFNLDGHARQMKEKHPGWSDRQCRCVLYWQPKSRKRLKERVVEAKLLLRTTATTTIPEALGVNVYATALKSGLKLEKIKSLSICRHVALLGHNNKGQVPLF